MMRRPVYDRYSCIIDSNSMAMMAASDLSSKKDTDTKVQSLLPVPCYLTPGCLMSIAIIPVHHLWLLFHPWSRVAITGHVNEL
jgi:hypothetical protein